MEKFLFIYDIDDEQVQLIVPMTVIANVVGCRDFNETSNHMVYQFTPNGLVKLSIHDYPRDLCIELQTDHGYTVAAGYYPDH